MPSDETIKELWEDEKKENPILAITKKEMELINRVLDSYNKVDEYIRPFLEQNKKELKNWDSIKLELIALPMLNLALHTAYATQTMMVTGESIEKIFKKMEQPIPKKQE